MASIAIMCTSWSVQAQTSGAPKAPEPEDFFEFTELTLDEGATHYYLYNPDAKMFFYSGYEYNTRAALANKGFEIWFTTSTEQDAPAGSLEFWDYFNNPDRSDVSGDHNLFTDDNGNTWVDHASQGNYSWTIEKAGDFYRIQNVALIEDVSSFSDTYFGWAGDETNYRLDMLAEGAGFIDWKLVTVESYNNAFDLYSALLTAYNHYMTVRDGILNIDSSIDVSAADAKAEGASTVEEYEEAVTALRDAFNDYLATVEGELDFTSFIVNPSFETGNTTGWTYQTSNDHGAKPNSNGVYTIDNADGNYVFNIWSSGNAISQTITDLPNGNYKMMALIATDAGHQVQLNANTQSVVVDASEEGKGHGVDGEVEFTVLDGTATIGAEGVDKYWYKVDNFRLYFLGALTDLTPYANRLAEVAGEAEAIEQGTIPAAMYTVLTTAIDDYYTNKVWSSVEDYEEAIAAIEDATNAAKALIAPYATFLEMKAIAEELAAANSDNAAGKADLVDAISTQSTNVEAAVGAEEIETATADLKGEMSYYANSSNPVGEGERFNLTFMLTNPDLTNLPGWEKAEGWYNDQTQPTQNSQVMNSNNAVANSADPTKFAMYEYWSAGTEPTEGYVVYQKVTLPEGTYKMTALAFAGFGGGHRYGYQTDGDHGLGPLGDGSPNITFSAGEIDGTPINTPTLEDASIDFVQEVEGEVKIGLKAHAGNRSNWMGIGYVQLFKVQSVEIEIDEDVAFEAESVAGKVSLKRVMNPGEWNTFAVPFSITNEELMATFGEGTEVAEFSEALATETTVDEETGDDVETPIENESIIAFNLMETPAITANRPVLLKPVSVPATAEYVFYNRTVAAGFPFVAGLNFEFVGNYDGEITLTENDYFLNANKIYKSNGTNKLKGTRAYIAPKADGARIVGFFIDGVSEDVTGIEGLLINNDFAGKLYNLNGQQVKSAKKGLYIRDGKKVVVK